MIDSFMKLYVVLIACNVRIKVLGTFLEENQLVTDHSCKYSNCGKSDIYSIKQSQQNNDIVQNIFQRNTLNDYLILNQPKKCKFRHPNKSLILVLVHSACNHRPQRDAIRDTWGNHVSLLSKYHPVVILFVLGGCGTEYNDKLKKEWMTFKDILQFDFLDTYQNLTLKVIGGMLWVSEFCNNAHYIVKADDDTFVNIKYLKKLFKYPDSNPMIVGHRHENSTVRRSGIWEVSKELYEPEIYPSYCSGSIYVMNLPALKKLLSTQEKSNLKIINIEDAYITGILANKSEISCTHLKSFPRLDNSPSLTNIEKLLKYKLIALHWVPTELMYKIWDFLKKLHSKKFKVQDIVKSIEKLKNWKPVL